MRRMNATGPSKAQLLLACLAVPMLGTAESAHAGEVAEDNAVDFARDVRPILSENCFACHGPDAGSRRAGLRLDTREGALADLGGYASIVPGNLKESETLVRIATSDPDDLMPPPDSGKVLSSEQKILLQRWVKQGAPYAGHWAFVPPLRPPVPRTGAAPHVANGIDQFVLHTLKKKDLKPTARADRATLIRRVSLDLTGLPPTPQQVDTFVADRAPGAYQRLVQRLLVSPHYGERMALMWLDAARYADTHGLHHDNQRDMWPWRDWVIDAFNNNMPFDQFTVEQIAGDLLPGATRSQKIASGFNRNHMISWQGSAVEEENRVEYVIDRTNTTATVWLGLTLGCAQCHDHKFDPISQKDYYRFYAYFNSIREKGTDGRNGNAEPLLLLSSPVQQERWIGNSIAATQPGSRPGVVRKQVTASQPPKTARPDAHPPF